MLSTLKFGSLPITCAKGASDVGQLSGAFHNCSQDSVDPGRVALAILHEPIVDLFIKTRVLM